MKVLCGDIGGTKTRLSLFEVGKERLELREERFFPSQEFASLENIVSEFLHAKGISCERACFGIAGPVRDGRSKTTNLPWVVDGRRLARDLGIAEVSLLNDLEANAYGIAVLAASDFLVLNEGNPKAVGNAAVISAGTGLGEAGLYWDGEKHHPFASEGGHADFAPGNELEIALFQYLSKRYGRVSWERVLSGPGLVNIYQFLCEYRQAETPTWLDEEMRTGDPGSAISDAGLTGKCHICAEALDIFVRLYGAEAGNLALKVMAMGGMYLGGGIAPKIAEKLKGPDFMQAFLDKGRMRNMLEEIPIKVILNDRAALLGAARYAAFGQAAYGLHSRTF